MKLNIVPKDIIATLDVLDGIKYGDSISINQKRVVYDKGTMSDEEFEKRIENVKKYFRKLLHYRSEDDEKKQK
jgi:hypothetical protein